MENGWVAGIVSEYNPFHNGHAWMIRRLREEGASAVVCVMSGCYTQRAEPALFPPHLRAEAALAGGADLVLRLPLPWCAASAEAFGVGGAGLLAALGCVDVLAFGAETPDTALLDETAGLLLGGGWAAQLKKELACGVSFAAARATAAEKLLQGSGAVLAAPNNILGVEYCKALRGPVPAALQGGAPLSFPKPLALPRKGAGHDGEPQNGIASASWLRALAQAEGAKALRPWVPAVAADLYEEAARNGQMLDSARWDMALLSRLKGLSAADFSRFAPAGEGLQARIADAVCKAATPSEMYALAKSKRFAHSRVRRLALHAALNLPATSPVVPPYIHVLAANKTGLSVLKKAKSSARRPVSVSMARLAQANGEAAALARTEAAAWDLYAFCLQAPAPGGALYTRPAVFAL